MDDHANWKRVNGDETYALNWDIGSSSMVWEIGGFEGRWAKQISDKYNPYMKVFEPTDWGYGKCSAVFLHNRKVDVLHYGLWVMEANLPLYNPGNDAGSLLMAHANSEVCRFVDVYEELEDEVDLCLMNIEGAEFALLPYMIGNDLMKNIRYFWCQFHTFADPLGTRFLRIHEGLKHTHHLKWNFFPTAVAWERK